MASGAGGEYIEITLSSPHAPSLPPASVPGYYREVFVSMCPSGSSSREGSSSRVPRDIWLKCATTSSLPQTTLTQVCPTPPHTHTTHSLCPVQIWSICDSGESGSLNRDGLYKSLALLAIAQQGKAVDKTSLSTLGTGALPFTMHVHTITTHLVTM